MALPNVQKKTNIKDGFYRSDVKQTMKKIMRKKAVRGSRIQRNPVIVNRVSKSDIAILTSRLEPILSANREQRILGEIAITDSYLGM